MLPDEGVRHMAGETDRQRGLECLGKESAGMRLHSTVDLSASISAGFCAAHSISENVRWQQPQDLPRYQSVRMLRTRHASGDSWIWARHSWPHPACSGQREHAERRNEPKMAARPAPRATPAGRRFSGQVMTRSPRYRSQTIRYRMQIIETNPIAAATIQFPINQDSAVRNASCRPHSLESVIC